MRDTMRCFTLSGVLAALALLPAGALAGAPHATVLSVDRHHRTLQLVDAGHLVHAYRYRGTVPRLGLSDAVSFRRSGRTISHVIRTAPASGVVSFYAQVVRASAGTVRVRLGDGSALRLSAPGSIRAQALTPGATVLIRESARARGHRTIAISLPATTTSGGTVASGGAPSAEDQVAEGTITRVSGGALAISADAGSLSFSVDPSSGLTDGFTVGDLVDVSYAQNADGSLSADDVEYAEQDASGEVTAVSDASITVADHGGGAPLTIAADPGQGLFDGILAGDVVDVAYHASAVGPVADSVDDQSWGR
jgi:uncharacterized protein DUF5666